MIGMTIDAIAVGDSAQITRRVTDGDIASFVDAVGDYNPVHSDRAYAAETVFKICEHLAANPGRGVRRMGGVATEAQYSA